MARSIEMTELERKKLADAGRQSIPCTYGWRPIETAPKDGTVIIVYAPDFFQTAAWTDEKWTNAANSWLEDVTHWMPLPQPPEGKE